MKLFKFLIAKSDLVKQYNTVLVNLLDKDAPLTTSRCRVHRSDCFFDEDCRAKKKTMRLVERCFESGRVGKSGNRRRATTEELSIGSALTTGEERSSEKKSSAFVAVDTESVLQ